MMIRQMLSTVSSGRWPPWRSAMRAHHRRLARRPERRAAALAGLDGDQPVDDLAALDQQSVHRRVDAIDFDAQLR